MKEETTSSLDDFFRKKNITKEEIRMKLDSLSYGDESIYYPHVEYIRDVIDEKKEVLNWKITFSKVFRNADINSKEGSKILDVKERSRKKPNRDYLIRICYGAWFTLEEVNRALKYCGYRELYSKIPREACLIILFSKERINENIDIEKEVNEYLIGNGFEPLDKPRD